MPLVRVSLSQWPASDVGDGDGVYRFAVALAGSKGSHHLVAFILYVVAFEIVVEFRLHVALHLLVQRVEGEGRGDDAIDAVVAYL